MREGESGRIVVSALCLFATLYGSALAALAADRVDGWDAVVDLDHETSCRPIAAALQPLLEGKVASRFIKVTGSLTGSPDALGLPVLYRNGGAKPGPALETAVRACVPLIPTTRAGYFRGAPVADGSNLTGVLAHIHFENVELTVRCEQGQTRDFVALFLGAGWLSGYEQGSHEYSGGTISGGVVLSGLLRVRFEGDCDGGRKAGVAPELRPKTLLSERGTGRAVMFVNGLMRSDLTKLTLDATGWPAEDHDDLCVVHHHSWGVRVQGLRCGEFGGGGILAYGSADSSYRDVYVTGGTGAGLYLGDPSHGAAISSFAAGGGLCVGDDGDARDGVESCGQFLPAALESFQLTGVIEGNSFGNALAFGAVDRVRLDFRGEGGGAQMRGPNLGLFGGRCEGGARDGLPGFVDSVFSGPTRDDCPGGRLRLPDSKGLNGLLTVTGEVGSDRGFDGANAKEPDWNGIDIGAGFRSGVVRLAASISGSDVGCDSGCDDSALDARWLALLGADSDARGMIDLTGYTRSHARIAIGPYPFVRHDGERWIAWRAGSPLALPPSALPSGAWIAHVLRSGDATCELELADTRAGSAGAKPLAFMRGAAAKPGGAVLYLGRVGELAGASVRAAKSCANPARAAGELQLIPSGN